MCRTILFKFIKNDCIDGSPYWIQAELFSIRGKPHFMGGARIILVLLTVSQKE